MRNDDIDELDLSQHRSSRLPAILVIGAAIGVGVIAAWVFTPLLMSPDSATTASLLPMPRPAADQAAPMLASAGPASAVPAPDATAAAATDDAATPRAPAPAPQTTASTPWNNAAAPAWPQSRGIQVAAAPAAAALPPAEGDARLAAATPDTPTEAVDNVPLPRKRPSRLIAASLVIPLPRPRPETEPEAPAAPTAFDLQVERMR